MRIASVRIQNLRSFKDETVVFDPYTCLVGPNGAGKSNVLCALNIFFGGDEHSPTDLVSLEEEDFHNKDTSEPIRITVTFTDLSLTAKEDLKAYVRQDRLVVAAVAKWDAETRSAKVTQVGERLVMQPFAKFFAAEKKKTSASDLKDIFVELRKTYPDVNAATTKDAMREALREFEEGHAELCELMESPDLFYGFSKGDHLLARHLQWVFVPAVKDASTEHREVKDSALGRLLARTVRTQISFKDRLAAVREEANRKYQEVLEDSQNALEDLSARLSEGLAQWATPGTEMELVWHADKDKSVTVAEPYAEIVASDGAFSGTLTRFGHGLQRSYLLALLQLIAASAGGGDDPTLILGVEEPELFQHPPQARHLANVLTTLAEKGSQVVICTHSPLFVRGESFESVRLVRRDQATGASLVAHCLATHVEGAVAGARGKPTPKREAAIARLDQELSPELNELFFAPYIVLVEGTEDVAYIKAHMLRLRLMDRFRALGGHFIPAHAKSRMVKPLAILKAMKIPHYCLFDADGDCEESKAGPMHKSDNRALYTLLGVEDATLFPDGIDWGDGFTVWPTNLTAVVEADFGKDAWNRAQETVRAAHGHPAGIQKNAYFIAEYLQAAWDAGGASETIERLAKRILDDAARKVRGAKADQA